MAVYDLLPDPRSDRAVWLATSKGILRSDDLGQSMHMVGRNAPTGTTDLVALPEPGHLLAAGSQGAWETQTGA